MKINNEQRLYVIPSSHGYSCLGFDVAERRRQALYGWLALKAADMEPGTEEHYADYQRALRLAEAHYNATGQKCPVELEPRLVGLEGYRIEVRDDSTGHKERFWVGRSCGWIPVHIALHNTRSIGGPVAYVPEGATIQIIRRGR